MFKVFAIITICCLASSASLADQFGTVNADYEGEQKEWFTITLETSRGTAATATFRERPMWATIHMQAQPQSTTPTTIDVLTIKLTYRTPLQINQEPLLVEITHMPSGTSGPIWTNEGSPNQRL